MFGGIGHRLVGEDAVIIMQRACRLGHEERP